MRIVRAMFVVVLMMGVLFNAAPVPVSAEELPELTEVSDPGFVSPELCISEPADIDRIKEIIGSSTATPIVEEDLTPLLVSDQVVTGNDAEAVRTLLLTMMGCVNANDPLRFISLFTDSFHGIYRERFQSIVEEAEAQANGEFEPQPLENGYVLFSHSDVFRLDDARLIYTVTAAWNVSEADAVAAAPQRLLQIVAADIDGEWLIDELRIAPFDARPESGVAIVEPDYSGWIMPVTQAESASVLFLSMSDEVIGGFIPTGAEIAEAEAGLSSALQQHERATPGLIERLTTYQRQYLGLETGTGRLLVINGFCDSMGMDPATTLIAVEDGGDCYWHAIYNLTNGSYDRVYVNGES